MYDPTTGRFNRLDPFAGNVHDPQSLHKHAYVHGDPVNGIDPLGLFSQPAVHSLFASLTVRAPFQLNKGGVGHHWISSASWAGYNGSLSQGAQDVFGMATVSIPNYNHNPDTWLGVTHSQYNTDMKALLGEYITLRGGKQISATDAKHFVQWIASGAGTNARKLNSAFKGGNAQIFIQLSHAMAGQLDNIRAYRKGVLKSVVVAEALVHIASDELNWGIGNKTQAQIDALKKDVKAIARAEVNGGAPAGLSSFGDELLEKFRFVKANANKVTKYMTGAYSRLLKGIPLAGALGFLSAGSAAHAGWNGQVTNRAGHNYGSGFVGALQGVGRDVAAADLVEWGYVTAWEAAYQGLGLHHADPDNRIFRNYRDSVEIWNDAMNQ